MAEKNKNTYPFIEDYADTSETDLYDLGDILGGLSTDDPRREAKRNKIRQRGYEETRPFNMGDIAGEELSIQDLIDAALRREKNKKPLTPSEQIDLIRRMNDPADDAREQYGKADYDPMENYNLKKSKKIRDDTEAAAKIAPRDTVLGRIFDKRIMDGEEISNRDKAFSVMGGIGRGLTERRVKGDQSSTLDRILGGAIAGGDQIKILEDEVTTKRAADQELALQRQIQALDYQKTQSEIGKIDSETTKNIADAIAGGDKPTAIRLAEYQAKIRGFNVEKDPQAYYTEVDKIMSVGISQGQSSVYETIQGMETRLQGMDDNDPAKLQLQKDIAELRARSAGTTIGSSTGTTNVVDQTGKII
tara:strand:- start:995 stop:2077 length:1083 start_codon:yes stop_codon:yes gene_type:complete